MIDWLTKEELYDSDNKSNKFIDKTLKAFFEVSSSFQHTNANGYIYKMNTSLKMIIMIGWILFISLNMNILVLMGSIILEIVLLGMLDNSNRRNVIRISLIIPIFTFIMVLPSIISGNNNGYIIPIKVFLSLIIVNSFSASTRWHDIIKALKLFRVSDIFIFTIELTVKYIFILSKLSQETFYALKKKTIGNKSNRKTIGNIIGNLFIKSYGMSEETYFAMECRGYTGEYRDHSWRKKNND